MTDLTPAQAEAVRRALADARHTGPVPSEVVDRLAATLADLAAERETPMVAAAFAAPPSSDTAPGTATAPATVIPLRRRRLPAVLAAAAAVTAFAVVAPQLGGSDDRGGVESSLAEDAREESAAATAPDSALSEAPPAPLSAEDGTAFSNDLNRDLGSLSEGQVLRLHDATLEQDLAPVIRRPYATAHGGAPWTDTYNLQDRSALDSAAKTTPQCGPDELAAGSATYAARYHRHAALVVVLPATNDGVPVEIYDCEAPDPGAPARTVVLDAVD